MRIVLIIICLIFFKVNAQTNKTLKESYVDSVSYVYSMKGNHKELVTIANQAFDSKIDFYSN